MKKFSLVEICKNKFVEKMKGKSLSLSRKVISAISQKPTTLEAVEDGNTFFEEKEEPICSKIERKEEKKRQRQALLLRKIEFREYEDVEFNEQTISPPKISFSNEFESFVSSKLKRVKSEKKPFLIKFLNPKIKNKRQPTSSNKNKDTEPELRKKNYPNYQKAIASACRKTAKATFENSFINEDEDDLWEETDKIVCRKIQRKEEQLEKRKARIERKEELSRLVEIESENFTQAPQKITAFQIQMMKERERLQAAKLKKKREKLANENPLVPNLNHLGGVSAYKNYNSSVNISASGIDNALAALSVHEGYTPEYERKITKKRLRNLKREHAISNNKELSQIVTNAEREHKKFLAKRRRGLC